MRTTSITGLCIAFAGAGTNLSTPDARRRTFHIARVLTRTIKTLTYIGVGHHDCNESMYESYLTISVNRYCDFFSQFDCAFCAFDERG